MTHLEESYNFLDNCCLVIKHLLNKEILKRGKMRVSLGTVGLNFYTFNLKNVENGDVLYLEDF